MKRIIHLYSLLLALLVGTGSCSQHEAPSLPPAEAKWNVRLTRSAVGGTEPVTVALRYDDVVSYGTLTPAEESEANAEWVENPTWPDNDATSVEVITLYPAVSALPATIRANEGKAYKMDYTACTPAEKPASFTFTHLMAQLEVHIKISDDEAHHYQPTDATITFSTEGTVNYAGKQLTPMAEAESFSLGIFTKEGENTEMEENWVNTPQVVIPQTLPAHEPCLTFQAGEKRYTFIPEEAITFTAGKVIKLYLGVAYENDYVTLSDEGVTITDWSDGGTLNGGVVEETTEE